MQWHAGSSTQSPQGVQGVSTAFLQFAAHTAKPPSRGVRRCTWLLETIKARVSRFWSSQAAGGAALCRPHQSSKGRRQHELAYSKRPLLAHMTRSRHDLPARLPASGAASAASTADDAAPSSVTSNQAESQANDAWSRGSCKLQAARSCSVMPLTCACCCQEDAATDHKQERGVGGPPRRLGTVRGCRARDLAGEPKDAAGQVIASAPMGSMAK